MPNRYYSTINGKLSAPKPPSQKGGGRASYGPEKTHAWSENVGPVGPARNKVRFKEVPQSVCYHMPDDKSPKKERVGKKISKLMHEGKPQDQAVAMALNMEREHRLTDSGGYKRKR